MGYLYGTCVVDCCYYGVFADKDPDRGAIASGSQLSNADTAIMLQMTTAQMKEESFVTILNEAANIYNAANPTATQLCGWVIGADGYPTLKVTNS